MDELDILGTTVAEHDSELEVLTERIEALERGLIQTWNVLHALLRADGDAYLGWRDARRFLNEAY